VQRDQCGFAPPVILAASVQAVSTGKELQRESSRGFLILRATAETMSSLPYGRFDDFERDFTAGENSLERTTCPAVFEATRRTLSGHRLRALNPRTIWAMRPNPSSQREDVNAFLGAAANGRNIDRVDEPRHCAVFELDHSETAVNTRVDTQNSDHDRLAKKGAAALRGQRPERR
jgi:hypothetical protein